MKMLDKKFWRVSLTDVLWKEFLQKMMTVKKCYSQKFDEITVINIFNEMIQEIQSKIEISFLYLDKMQHVILLNISKVIKYLSLYS